MAVTSLNIPDDLHEKIKTEKIEIRKTCIDALKKKVNKTEIIEAKKEELKEINKKAKNLRQEIKDLETAKKQENVKYGDKEQRINKGLEVLRRIENKNGVVMEEDFKTASRISKVSIEDLEEALNQ